MALCQMNKTFSNHIFRMDLNFAKLESHQLIGKVSSGVPRGCILGPLLFITYMNNLPHCIRNGHVTICMLTIPVNHAKSD